MTDDEKVFMAFARRQFLRRIMWGVTVACFLAAALFASLPNVALTVVCSGAAVLGIGFFEWRYWRCPVCDKPLGREVGAHCTHCGARLTP